MEQRRIRLLKFAIIGVAGYLVGSLLPFGYVAFLIRSWITPESAYQEPAFDRTALEGAKPVTTGELLDTLEQNPSNFANLYLNKPVIVTGQIDWFMEEDADEPGATLTLDVGEYKNIFLSFHDDNDPKLLKLRTGHVVQAVCLVTGTTSSAVHMDHCEVLESREVPT